MIDDFKRIEELFAEIDATLSDQVRVYVIGGAALLKRRMKAATKDIDLIVETTREFRALEDALRKREFEALIPGKEYDRMNLSQIYSREDFRIDVFVKEVCGRFSLSTRMVERGERVYAGQKIVVFLCSNEDIFLFKTMTEREGDIADCISIATTQGIDWDIVLDELKGQMRESKQEVWVTWVGERLDLLAQRGLDIPIMGSVDELRESFYTTLEEKQSRQGNREEKSD